MSDNKAFPEKQAPAEVATRIAERIESWLRPGVGRHYVGEAIVADLERAGWVIVPAEPTEDMINAGDDLVPIARGTETHRMMGGAVPEDFWRAMIAARPK